MKKNFVLLDIDYVTYEEKPLVRLFGKEIGTKKSIIALDDSFIPYFYIVPSDIELCISDLGELEKEEEIKINEIEVVTLKDFQVPKEFIKISFKHPQEVPKYRDIIRDLDSVMQIREHDIPFYRRYLIDKDLTPMAEIELVGEELEEFENIDNDDVTIIKLSQDPKTISSDVQDFRMMSFDLEVRNPHGMPNPDEDEIIMIGIDSNVGISKVISTKGTEFDEDEMNFIETVSSEKEMIESFVKTVKEANIDIIIGYNSDNFDFPYLRDRAKLLGVDLDLGMDGSNLKFLRRGYTNAATIKGLLHVDLYLVMRRYMSLDRYTLERVYLELFGEEKIDVPGDLIYTFWDNGGDELKNLFKYSLDDVVSTLKIAEQTLPLNLELTRIVGQPFFDVTRMATGQQAEWYLVRRAYEINEIVPNKPNIPQNKMKERGSNSGGYVKEPEKGLHENLVQFDFRSLYPSLIISKNISPDVLIKENLNKYSYFGDETGYDELDDVDFQSKDTEDYYVCPEHNHKFRKEPQGFIPSVMGDILAERVKIKTRMKASEDPIIKKSLDVQQQALKRLANTMYGVYGFSR
ncbi:MAG: DNA-directed DNA polymerase, partial [archaeon]|nr:DNA-directed DNA polymerase [archaeon]